MADKFDLTSLQKTVLDTLATSALRQDFYWTGGTALAFFYLKHRLSLDIDLFSPGTVDYQRVKRFVEDIARQANLKKIESQKIHDRWEFFLKNDTEVRLDLAHFDYKNLKPWKIWQGIKVDSLEDLAANKTLALIDRHDPKDAFDIYYIITKKKMSAEKLLELVKQKFGSLFPASLFWSQCLLGAKELKKIRPLMLDRSAEQIRKITGYFEKQSAKEIKKTL